MKNILMIFTLIFGQVAYSNTTQKDLQAAWLDENHAIKTYSAVVRKFGPVKPFVNILEAEYAHRRSVEMVAAQMGVFLDKEDSYFPPDFVSLQEACSAGVQGEILNIDLYDKMIAEEESEVVLNLFYKLKAASLEKHLPAFRRCAR